MPRLLLVLLLLGALCAHAEIVSEWDELAQPNIGGRPVAAPLQDEVARSASTLVALTMFEAANRIDPVYRSYLALDPATEKASASAAIAAGAHAVLVRLKPDQKDLLDEALRICLTDVPEGIEREAGLRLGVATAATVMERRLFDGPEAPAYRPLGEPGQFTPPMPSIIAPWSLRARPFFLQSWNEVMPPPPPPLQSERYARDFNEVKEIGGLGQAGATPAARGNARFLAGMNLDEMTRAIAAGKPRLVDRARFWALIRMAQHDSNAMTAIAKMRYLTWRPYNAIRNADRDGNRATERDANWQPVLSTPNHPEYPCGHCVASGLIAGLLAAETPGPVVVHSDNVPLPMTLTFNDWNSFMTAASLSRTQAGVHFRFSNEAGQLMGQRIATLALQRFAPPLK